MGRKEGRVCYVVGSETNVIELQTILHEQSEPSSLDLLRSRQRIRCRMVAALVRGHRRLGRN